MKTEILLDHECAADGTGYVVRALLRLHSEAPEVERTQRRATPNRTSPSASPRSSPVARRT